MALNDADAKYQCYHVLQRAPEGPLLASVGTIQLPFFIDFPFLLRLPRVCALLLASGKVLPPTPYCL